MLNPSKNFLYCDWISSVAVMDELFPAKWVKESLGRADSQMYQWLCHMNLSAVRLNI